MFYKLTIASNFSQLTLLLQFVREHLGYSGNERSGCHMEPTKSISIKVRYESIKSLSALTIVLVCCSPL